MSYNNEMGDSIEKQTREDFEMRFMQNYQKKYNYNTKAKPTYVPFESMQIKDNTIKKLREEIASLNEEIQDLKTDLKSFIEMES